MPCRSWTTYFRVLPILCLLNASADANAAVDPPLAEMISQLRGFDSRSLGEAITDLTRTFGADYPYGPQRLSKLDKLEGQRLLMFQRLGRAHPPIAEAQRLLERLQDFRQRALIANPLVSGQPILFVVRPQYLMDHHNTATLFQTGEINTSSFRGGSALKVLDLSISAPTPRTRTLFESAEGLIRDPDLHYDGQRIVFSFRKNKDDDYHIYEIHWDGSHWRQLTSAPGVADIDPFYMPDQTIVFSSTREPKYCMCNRHIMANLFKMDEDGANIHQIGKSTLFEGHGSVLNDGRILYDRWEYIDRNFGDAQALWTVNPDGTNHALYWGNNTNSPGGVIDARAIPGSDRIVAIFGSCHDLPWGAVALLDRREGLDLKAGVVRTWPADAVNLIGVGDFDTFKRLKTRYEDPWPLNDKYFLVSKLLQPGGAMGLFLIDIFGNEILLHAEGAGCFDPIPLTPRQHPPVIAPRRDFDNEAGVFYVTDVYQGTHMKGVERGSVKYLRVVESPEKRFWSPAQWGGQGVHCPAMNWHDFNNKRILGTVPVESDGSAKFAVPSDKWVYFQLLDKDGMMVQSMRSGTLLQSREVAGCIGCHEQRHSALSPGFEKQTLAAQRAPSPMNGWHGEPRLFNFMTEVQPVLTKACLPCHDFGGEGAQKLLLAPDRTMTFNTAYNELWRKKYIKVVGAGPHETQAAGSWGARVSPLIQKILKGHGRKKLDAEGLERIITWIDLNGPFYPDYSCAYPDHLGGRSPLNPDQVRRLEELTQIPLSRLASFNANRGPQVSFDRPELSPCLRQIKDKESAEYAEALAIIQAGKEQLARRPRADMPGYAPNPVDQRRQEKYLARQQEEQRARQAIRSGQKAYDPHILPTPTRKGSPAP